MWYASSCSGIVMTTGVSMPAVRGIARITSFFGSRIAARRDRDHRPASGFCFLHVADHLFKHVVVWSNCDDRHTLIDQRDRPVLHLSCRVPFGVDVGNFLELQCALERDWIMDPPTQEQKIRSVVELLCDAFCSRGRLDRLFNDMRQLEELLDMVADLGSRERAA